MHVYISRGHLEIGNLKYRFKVNWTILCFVKLGVSGGSSKLCFMYMLSWYLDYRFGHFKNGGVILLSI